MTLSQGPRGVDKSFMARRKAMATKEHAVSGSRPRRDVGSLPAHVGGKSCSHAGSGAFGPGPTPNFCSNGRLAAIRSIAANTLCVVFVLLHASNTLCDCESLR